METTLKGASGATKRLRELTQLEQRAGLVGMGHAQVFAIIVLNQLKKLQLLQLAKRPDSFGGTPRIQQTSDLKGS